MPQQNLSAMLPTINYPSHPYSKGFSGKATIHPKSHTLLPQHPTKSGVEDNIGSFLFFPITETLLFLGTWQIPPDGQVSLSIHEPSKGLCHTFFQGIPLVQTSPQVKPLGSYTTWHVSGMRSGSTAPLICRYRINHINRHTIRIRAVWCSQILSLESEKGKAPLSSMMLGLQLEWLH